MLAEKRIVLHRKRQVIESTLPGINFESEHDANPSLKKELACEVNFEIRCEFFEMDFVAFINLVYNREEGPC